MASVPLTGLLKRVCCYCGLDMGTKPCEPRLDGQTSHGVCPACEDALRARLGLKERNR